MTAAACSDRALYFSSSDRPDGLFQHALISHLAGNADAAADLERSVPRVLDSLVACG